MMYSCSLPTATIADSFNKASKSAPENPTHRFANSAKSTVSPSFLFLAWIFRMRSLASKSGKPTASFKSKRPARLKASSRSSKRFVAQIVMTSVVFSKPSNSDNNALIVWSRSPFSACPLREAIASTSSIKTIHGAAFFARAYNSRTRFAPIPTYFSIKSLPTAWKNGTLASPAIAFAKSVLPVPGGPYRITPFGVRAPMSRYFCGFFKQSTKRKISCFNSSTPSTSENFTEGISCFLDAPVLVIDDESLLPTPTPSVASRIFNL